MPFYRKKPVVIEARRWDGSALSAGEIIDWALSHGGTIRYHHHAGMPGCPGLHSSGPFLYCDQKGCDWAAMGAILAIDTLEGGVLGSPGDYIIKGVQNEFYPCKPDIFDQIYEAVDGS